MRSFTALRRPSRVAVASTANHKREEWIVKRAGRQQKKKKKKKKKKKNERRTEQIFVSFQESAGGRSVAGVGGIFGASPLAPGTSTVRPANGLTETGREDRVGKANVTADLGVEDRHQRIGAATRRRRAIASVRLTGFLGRDRLASRRCRFVGEGGGSG